MVTITASNIDKYRTGSYQNKRINYRLPKIDVELLLNFPRLRTLEIVLYTSSLVLKGIEEIQSLTSLKITSILPINLEGITFPCNLTRLVIDGMGSVKSLDPIFQCKKLRTLTLNSEDITDAEMDELVKLENLRKLDIQMMYMDPYKCEKLKLLKNLVFLGIGDLESVLDLPKLRHLTVFATAESLSLLKNLTGLRSLDILVDNYELYSFNLNWLPNNLIQSLDLWVSTEIGSPVLLDTSKLAFLTDLKKIKFKNIEVKDLSFARNCPSLRSIYLRGLLVDNLDGLKTCTNLKSLKMGLGKGSMLIKPPGNAISLSPLRNCKKIKTLNLGDLRVCDLETLHHFSNLQNLSIQNIKVPDTNIEKTIELHQLEKLVIKYSDCENLQWLNTPRLLDLKLANCKFVHLDFGQYSRLENVGFVKSKIESIGNLEQTPLKLVGLINCAQFSIDKLPPTVTKIFVVDPEITEFPFKSFPRIRVIELFADNLISIEGIEKCQSLNYLDLTSSQIRDLSPIKYLNKLRTLSIDTNLLNHQDPYTKAFINKLLGYDLIDDMYHSDQNVHNSDVTVCIHRSVTNLLKDKEVELDLNDVISSGLSEKTIELIIEYCDCDTIHSELEITFAELFARVWARITCHPNTPGLLEILTEQMAETECECFQGRFNKLVSVLAGSYADIYIGASDSTVISNIVIQQGKLVDPYDAATHRKKAEEVLLENGYTRDQITPWLDAIDDGNDN